MFLFYLQYNVWWEQNKEVVEWLEKQQAPDSIVNMNLHAVRKDAVISQVDNVLKVITNRKTVEQKHSCLNQCPFFRTVRRRLWTQ